MNEYIEKADELMRTIDKKIDMLEKETKKSNLEENLEKLNNLIGLDNVKSEISKLINYLKFQKRLEGSKEKLNLNMVFKGNPGTGKTTVARIIAEILYNLGYLENEKFIETTPRNFIEGYIGQTGVTTKQIINKYKGGVIFIDEAYGFVSKDGSENFADEALTEIIKEMETKQTVFIFAGYEKEMEDFIDLNPGIKSRIGYNIKFKDYTEENLLEIFMKKLENNNLKITQNAIACIQEIIKIKAKEKNFGGGRMIDNLYNKIIIEHAQLTYNKEEACLQIITETSAQIVLNQILQN